MNGDRWLERRLALLEPAREWLPDASAALVRLRERERTWRSRRRRWLWIATAASVVSFSVLAIPGRCDSPSSTTCGQPLAGRIWTAVFPKPVERPVEVKPPAEAAPAPPAPPVAVAESKKPAAQARRPVQTAPAAINFRESGAADAPITCEIYTDYECPACAALYRQTIPLLMAQYVQTGKVKLLHRDLPLPQHPYARLAARYANAAGRLGYYNLVMNHLFQTQSSWTGDGGIDAQVAQAVPPGVMQRVRDLVRNDGTLDDTVTADVAMAMQDGIRQTPTIVVVSRGKRQAIEGVPEFDLLKTYLDQLLR